jgi:kynurenine formamidase
VRAADGPRAAPFGFIRIVFLSHVITAATIERDGYHLQSLVAGEQAGTHWAAPAHFAAGQAAADELDPGDRVRADPVAAVLDAEQAEGPGENHGNATSWWS